MKSMKKSIMSIIMSVIMVLGLTGCQTSKGTSVADDVDKAYPDAVSVLEEGWNQIPEQFPASGGSFENAVDNAPGKVDITNTDALTYTFLVPEEVQTDITDAATIMHMMNANTFTAVALHLNEMSTEDAATKIKEGFLANQFMCVFPDKIKIVSMGNYVVYAYGKTDNVDNFIKGIENLEHETVVADEIYQYKKKYDNVTVLNSQ